MVYEIESEFSVFSPPLRIFDFQTAEIIPAGESNSHFYRQISLGASLSYFNSTLPPLYAGAWPGSLMLTHPHVVFVHGINRGLNGWEESSNMTGLLLHQDYILKGGRSLTTM